MYSLELVALDVSPPRMVERVVEVVLGAEGGIRLDFLTTFDWIYCNEPNLLEIVLRMS